MSTLIIDCTIDVDLDGVAHAGGTAFVHDYALEGDEDLRVGKHVELTDGSVTVRAVVSGRDEEAGYWYFLVETDPHD